MAMNREQKRLLKKQGQLGEDGQPMRAEPGGRAATATAGRGRGPGGGVKTEERTPPTQFVREVRSELKKVAWPTRAEVINYSIIVLITLIIMTLYISGIDWVFGEAILRLFNAR